MYKMIVADDELWIRERIINSINWAEIGVVVAGQASDGEEALIICKKLMPDIILTDIRMPIISGLEFLKTLREYGLTAKIIIISGYNDFEYARQAIKLGVFDYILKPVENNEMVDIVKKCVRRIEAENGIGGQTSARIKESVPALKENDGLPHDQTDKSPANKTRRIVETAKKIIEENYHAPISLTDIAGKIALNPSYFCKIFRKSTGESFTKYLTRLRIKKAVEIMRDPTLKIYEVAGMVGYENVQYFIRVFKSMRGVSPNVFKEKYIETGSISKPPSA
jgi:two-component system response regulator YesN